MAPPFQQCKSHPDRLLVDHLTDVAKRLNAGTGDLWLAGLFHDLGKSTPYFQNYLNGKSLDSRLKTHSLLGACTLLTVLQRARESTGQPDLGESALLFLYVRRHHGKLDDLLDALSLTDDERNLVEAQIQSMDHEGALHWLNTILPFKLHQLAVPTHQELVKLRVSLHHALTNPSHEKAVLRFQKALESFGRLIDADRSSAQGLDPGYDDPGLRYRSEHLIGFRTNQKFGMASDDQVVKAREHIFRAAVAAAASHTEMPGGLWTLTSPTGSGKTLAALGWALTRRELRYAKEKRRYPIVYALPFTSIIDQTADILRDIWPEGTADESVLAVHHHLSEPGVLALRGEEPLARTLTEGWRADVVCTTFVQVVNAMFHGTTADARRFSSLAGSILILDEIQAIPAELWKPVSLSLATLSKNFGTDILLVTATQPALFPHGVAHEIMDSPTNTKSGSVFDRYDFHVMLEQELSTDGLSKWVSSILTKDHGRSAMIVLNTIQEALDLYTALKSSALLNSYKYLHLSTNLRPKDRTRILEKISEVKGAPHILVATQVVEAGVDLSFDLVFRALAPFDSLVQAAGRCNRHGTGPRGQVYVFDLEGSSGRKIYGDTHLALARELCREIKKPVGEIDLRVFVERYFDELARRLSSDRSRAILEAMQKLEFASLRGEGTERTSREKAVALIEEQVYRIPHFVETDDEDSKIWQSFLDVMRTENFFLRRKLLRSLRPALNQRIVEVPRKFAKGEPDPNQGIVHVPIACSRQYYDVEIGWMRNQ